MLGGCRNDNITRSALYVAMVHVFHYLVILYLLLWGISILLAMWRACTHTHTHTHAQQVCILKGGVFSTLIKKIGLFVSSK